MQHGIELTVKNTGELIKLTVENDYLLSEYNISSPDAKVYTVNINGMDGQLDYTEMFGSVKFNNRTITATISLAKFSKADQEAIHRNLMLKIHGQNVKIAHWQSPNIYYYGRCLVGEITKDNSKFTLTVDVDPYGYLTPAKEYGEAVFTGETKTIAVSNAGKPISPLFTVTGTVTLVYNEATYTLSAGDHNIIDFIIATGDSDITVTGNGTIKVTYTECVL